MRRGAAAPRRGALVSAAALLVIAVATMSPLGHHTFAFSWCFTCAPRAGADALMNVALFVPLGIGLRLWTGSTALAFIGGACLTLGIELAQTVVPGRDPSITDIASNSVGALIGASMAGWPWLWRPSAEASARLALASAAAGVAVTVAAGLLVAPAFTTQPYWSQWTPQLASMPAYPGTLLSASIDGHDIPAGPVADAAGLEARLTAGAPIVLSVRAGAPPQTESTVFSLAESDRLRPLVIGATHDDVFVRYRTRAVDYRFSQPELWATGLLAGIAPGDRYTLTVRRDGERACLQAGDVRRCDLTYRPGDAWMLLISRAGMPPALQPAAPLGWLAMLAAPVGFWWRRGVTGTLAVLLLPIGVLAIAPAMTALSWASPREWLALAGGGLLGLAVARLAGTS